MIQDPNYKAWHNAYTEQHKHWPHGETSWQAGRDFEREKTQSALQAKEAEPLTSNELYEIVRGTGYVTRDQADEIVELILKARPVDSARAAGDGEGKR